MTAAPPKLRPMHMRLPVFVVVVAGCALVFWAWKYNRANRDAARATMTLDLGKLAKGDDSKTRAAAASALAGSSPEYAAEAVEPLLLAATRDPSPAVRAAAARALMGVLSGGAWERSGEEMASQVERALPALVGLLDDPDPTVRGNVAFAVSTTIENLARLRHGKVDATMDRVARALLHTLREDREATIRGNAAIALRQLRVPVPIPATPPATGARTIVVSPDPKLILPALDSALLAEPSPIVRLRMIEALVAYHRDPGVIPPTVLAALRREQDPSFRATIVQSLANTAATSRVPWTNSEEVWPVLAGLLQRRTVGGHLVPVVGLRGFFGPPPASAVPALVEAVSAPDIPYREEIARLLATGPNPPDPDALKRAASRIEAIALDELHGPVSGAAMSLSLLRVKTDGARNARLALIEKFRDLMKKGTNVNPGEVYTFTIISNFNTGLNYVAGLLANYGPDAADVVPELIALGREANDAPSRDLLAGVFLEIGPGARDALPLLKEWADADFSRDDLQPLQVAITMFSSRPIPLLASAEALYAIDPRAPETRSLVVPMARFAAASPKVEYRRAADAWLVDMIGLDPSLNDRIGDAARRETDTRIRSELKRLHEKFADLAPGTKGAPNAP